LQWQKATTNVQQFQKKTSKKLTKLEKNLTKNNGDGKTTKNLMMAMAI
jgi:hypothetical protein